VISYRPRSAVRDIAKAFGFSPGQQDAWSKSIDHWGALKPAGASEARDERRQRPASASGASEARDERRQRPASAGTSASDANASATVDDVPPHVIAYANELQTFPRHLGIHSGGMVICDRPVIEVCPVEWARMENRSVL